MLLPLLTALLALVTATVTATAAAAAPATLHTDHTLSGTLWDTRSGSQAGEAEMLAQAASARWVLLGEKHDNAVHHRLQARVVEALGRAGRKAVVVWEMVEPEQAAALEGATADAIDDLGAALEWEARGWPAWAEYQPIAEAALRYGFAMRAGKPPRSLVRRLSRGEPLPAELTERLAWERPYPAGVEAALLAELRNSHCGALPEAALAGMLPVQRLWDAWMADSIVAAAEADRATGAILIAGSAHVREDRAVPWQLRARGAGESFTLALVEVVAGRDAPADYPAFDETLFDYVWFTPRVDEDDPCAELRERAPGQN